MADKPKASWGGRREGAGRRKRPATSVSGIDLRIAEDGDPPEDIDSLAAQSAVSSIAALVRQLTHGTSDSAKIDAAITILDRGWGKPTVEAGADPMLPFLGRAPVRSLANEVRMEAQRYGTLAVLVLEKIRDNGSSEAVRMRAIRALLDRGFGTVTPARMPAQLTQLARQVGKKEQATTNAKAAAIGRYATPAPPRSLQ